MIARAALAACATAIAATILLVVRAVGRGTLLLEVADGRSVLVVLDPVDLATTLVSALVCVASLAYLARRARRAGWSK